MKQVLKATFPNLTGPVTSTTLQLNSPLPPGVILKWYGSLGTVPSGWGVCDGTLYNKADGSGTILSPNLTGRVTIAAGGAWTQGLTGGYVSNPALIYVNGHAITQAELPSVYWNVGGGSIGGTAWTGVASGTAATSIINPTTVVVHSGGSNSTHDHTIPIGSIPTLPPYMALYKIMKL